MKKLIGIIIAAVFALSLPVFAQTTTDDTKKRTETYGAEGKGQQGEMKRDQERKELKAGDKVYYNNRGKAVMLAIIGEEPIENGMNIVGSHIDSPRLDIKQNYYNHYSEMYL